LASLLRLKEIPKSFYGTSALKTAEVGAVLGENGAGKSTLIKILAALSALLAREPTSGTRTSDLPPVIVSYWRSIMVSSQANSLRSSRIWRFTPAGRTPPPQ
jgi:ABC-type Na+ transport system ATPase subunit NatA